MSKLGLGARNVEKSSKYDITAPPLPNSVCSWCIESEACATPRWRHENTSLDTEANWQRRYGNGNIW